MIATIAAVATAFQIYLGAQQFTQGAQTDLSAKIEKANDEIKQLKDKLEHLEPAQSTAVQPKKTP